jgi:hypothetical protein
VRAGRARRWRRGQEARLVELPPVLHLPLPHQEVERRRLRALARRERAYDHRLVGAKVVREDAQDAGARQVGGRAGDNGVLLARRAGWVVRAQPAVRKGGGRRQPLFGIRREQAYRAGRGGG